MCCTYTKKWHIFEQKIRVLLDTLPLMKSPLALFTGHPASVGETYLQHLVSAVGFSVRMLGAGIACLIHALLPFLFVNVGSSTITKLHERMVLNRARPATAESMSSHARNAKALPTR
jgi:hypothetical protein